MGSGRLAGCREITAVDPVRIAVLLPVCPVSRILPILTCFSRLFPISHLSLSVHPLQVRPFAPTLSRTSYLSCLRMRPTCRQLPAGAAPRQVLLSFLQRVPRTVGEVKDSWAPAHSRGRSCGLDSFLPIPTSPGVFGLQRTLRLYLVVSFLCALGKPSDPLEGKPSHCGCRITKRALGADFALGFGQLQKQSKLRSEDSALLRPALGPMPAA